MRRQKGGWGKQGVEVVFWVPRAEGWAQERPPGERGFSVTWHFWRCAKWAAWIMLPSVRGAVMLPRVYLTSSLRSGGAAPPLPPSC